MWQANASIRAQITALELPCAFLDLTRGQGLDFLELLEIDEQILFSVFVHFFMLTTKTFTEN